MISVDNFDELKNFLQNDKDKPAFNPVRFINVETLTDWFSVQNFIGSLTTHFIFLSDYCIADDAFPNIRNLRANLKNLSQSAAVLPLSEILRIKPDIAERELNGFLNLYQGTTFSFRVYFLMYGLKNFFLSLNIADIRKKDCIILCNSETSDGFALTLVQKTVRLKPAGDYVDGFKQYFRRWEKSLETSLIVQTENAVWLQEQNFFDNVKIISNAFDLLRHYYALPADFQKNFCSDEDWQQLAESAVAAGNFERAFCQEFKVNGFGINVLKNFGKLEKFKRFFLWLMCKLQNGTYAARCAKVSSSPDDFSAHIYELIFSLTDEKNFDELCEERRELLTLMKILPSENFIEQVRKSNKRTALKILTETSHAEKVLIFETLQRFKFNDLDTVQKILQRTFPALSKYLSEVDTSALTAEQADYFGRYRWLKVTNRITADFNRHVTELATNGNIFDLTARNKIVSEEYAEDTAIIFVDGLGAEYLNFFAADFESLNEKFSVKYLVGRCNLPSITEVNKDFLNNRNVIGELLDLDTFKHTNQNYPENILGELKILVALKEKILRGLHKFKKIILCADHGTSRLAVLAREEIGKTFPSDGRQIYKHGRFADAREGDEKIFPQAVEYDGKIIFADYSRFIRKGAPGAEIHGGATLEEILVPVIAIEKKEKNSKPKSQSTPIKKVKRGIVANKNFDI